MKTRLHYDNIIYQLQRQGGISRYWQEITKRTQESNIFEIQNTVGNKFNRYLPICTNSEIFHSSYYRLPISKNANTKKVVTIHDLTYELGFIKTFNKSINILQTKLAIKTSDAIICVSENTKKDLLLNYSDLINHQNIYTVSHGVSLKFDEHLNLQPPTKLLISMNSIKEYIIFVGKRVKYKNFEAAIIGFFESCLPNLGFSMICVGSKFSETEHKLIQSLNLQGKILIFENVTNQELNYLYQNAFALVYPSLYEGFGLPPLEAMNCNCPVIASNTSSIPEVVGDAGILINPNNTNKIASALESLLSNEVRNSYIAKGSDRAKLFSWEKTAQKHIEIYQSLANS